MSDFTGEALDIGDTAAFTERMNRMLVELKALRDDVVEQQRLASEVLNDILSAPDVNIAATAEQGQLLDDIKRGSDRISKKVTAPPQLSGEDKIFAQLQAHEAKLFYMLNPDPLSSKPEWMSITQRVEWFCSKEGMSRSDLLSTIGCPEDFYANLERDENAMQTGMFRTLSTIFPSLNLHWLITGEGIPELFIR